MSKVHLGVYLPPEVDGHLREMSYHRRENKSSLIARFIEEAYLHYLQASLTPEMKEMIAAVKRQIAASNSPPSFIGLPIPGLPPYTARLVPDEEDGGYTVRCPEIPAAISQGETIEEALLNIRDAVELCLEVQDELQPLSEENHDEV